MSERNDSDLLADILEAAERILTYTNLDIVWEIVSKELATVADSLERISEEGGS